MKTLWFCSIVTTMLAQSIYASPLIHYQYQNTPKSLFKYGDNNNHDLFSELKRSKPSLSIVNPLDVLRQRLLLEIARRQMRENTERVEKNRMILKSVGKRVIHYPQDQQQVQEEFNDQDWPGLNHPQTNHANWIGQERSGSSAMLSRPFSTYRMPQSMSQTRYNIGEDEIETMLNTIENDPNRPPQDESTIEYEEQGHNHIHNNRKRSGLPM